MKITALAWRRERNKQANIMWQMLKWRCLLGTLGHLPKVGQLTQTRSPRKITRGWLLELGGHELEELSGMRAIHTKAVEAKELLFRQVGMIHSSWSFR